MLELFILSEEEKWENFKQVIGEFIIEIVQMCLLVNLEIISCFGVLKLFMND